MKISVLKIPAICIAVFGAAVGLIGGCATQNLADNPVNRAAGVLASALAGVNRSVASGLDRVDRNTLNIKYKSADTANEYFMSAELGLRHETVGGPNPDTTFRPAMALKSNEICKGQFRLLNEHNPQASIAMQRGFIERRIERELAQRTGKDVYGLPAISSYEQQILKTYPNAGLVWHIRCGEGNGWTAPPVPKFDVTTVPPQDRGFIERSIQQVNRLVGNVPPLESTLYPKALLLVPTEIAMKDLILRSGQPNPPTTVLFWAVCVDGLSRAVEHRKIFGEVERQEASRLPVSAAGRVVVYFAGEDLNILVPGESSEVVRINAENYAKYVGPLGGRKFRQDEGMELMIRVVENAADRAAKSDKR